jgi:YHS domain-containing protein
MDLREEDGMAEQVVDVVCGMKVDPDNAPAQTTYEGTTYYFCAPGCKVAFEKNPDRYLQGDTPQGHEHHTH